MRLDKFLVNTHIGSRKEVKKYCKEGLVKVNDITAKKSDILIDENKDLVTFKGEPIIYREHLYLMMNKPKGVICATEDSFHKTVVDLLNPDMGKFNLFPVGRLDKDTEGLLILTNDGEITHNLLSPNKKIPKTYYLESEKDIEDQDITKFKEGLDLGDFVTQPASFEKIDNRSGYLTITEGKFHQVKRMLQATCNKVLYLKRVSMAGITLDGSLNPGDYRELTAEEIQIIKDL